MTTSFATLLAARLKGHSAFWDDFNRLQVESIQLSMQNDSQFADGVPKQNGSPPYVDQLLYCASVFAQTEDESNRKLAQDIALGAILRTTDTRVRERTVLLLAEIGNFPGVAFLLEKYDLSSSTLLGQLQVDLLRAINTVAVGSVDRALTDFQLDVWQTLSNRTSTSISAPTSAGKSFVVIEYICQRISREPNYTAIYIAPTRALLAEVYKKISERLKSEPDIRITTVPSFDQEDRKRQVFVLTQERLHVLLAIAAVRADLIVVDEAQNISDGARGMILQDCLERARGESPNAQLLMLSPGAEGFSALGRTLSLGEIAVKETSLSPVLQNRIHVKQVDGSPKELKLSMLSSGGSVDIGTVRTKRGAGDPATRLAAVALELGGSGASLVYATGPAEAEKIARQIASDLPQVSNDGLEALSAFIAEHIHPKYGLAELVRHGVAFHYGRMPTLLREALEGAFRRNELKFLVCTTTLFQGVNLPARSVFINTPTRGRGKALDSAHLWNFAGRAGRLGKDLIGNVFLVDYDMWQEQSFSVPTKYVVTAALSKTVENNYSKVVEAIRGSPPPTNPQDSLPADIRAAAGLMLARASAGRAHAALDRMSGLDDVQKKRLEIEADTAAAALKLPKRVIEDNWTVDLYGLQKLAGRMLEKIGEGEVEDLVPIHPRESAAFERYKGIFSRIARHVLGYRPQSAVKYGSFVATYAVPWMKGTPYPVLLAKWINFKSKDNPTVNIDSVIRAGFEFLEDVIRFQMVQLGKAYTDVLRDILNASGEGIRSRNAFDYSLALELGVSSPSGRSFVELGLSRIAAVALEQLFPDSELTPAQAREKLLSTNFDAIALSPVIVDELVLLDLVRLKPSRLAN
jgi:hypothetical protein